MDFGIALPPEGKDIVAAGQVVGTPAYLAPERIRGDAGDARSDLYSLGVMLYELVCGKIPFEGATVTELMTKHLRDLPDPPSRHSPEMPADLEAVILRLLEKAPDRRFASLDDLLEALAGIRAGERPPVVVLALPERALRKLVHLRLAVEKIAVVPAANGEEAIEQVLRWQPDVAILDLHLPVVDGLDVVRYLRSRPVAAKVPLFLVSGSRDPQYDRFARSLGVESVHRKPVVVRDLVHRTVERVAAPPAGPGEFH
jgi:serine/threonine-protein kinase